MSSFELPVISQLIKRQLPKQFENLTCFSQKGWLQQPIKDRYIPSKKIVEPPIESGKPSTPDAGPLPKEAPIESAKIQEPIQSLEDETFVDAVEIQPHMHEPIWQAARNGDHRAFFAEVRKKPKVLNLRDESGQTPLDWLPESPQKTSLYESVKHLLEQDVFVDALETQPNVHNPILNEPIWEAARSGNHRAFFAEVQKKPALLNLTDEAGRKPLDLMSPSARKDRMVHSLLSVMRKYRVSEGDKHIRGSGESL